jgi:hypothetical protein
MDSQGRTYLFGIYSERPVAISLSVEPPEFESSIRVTAQEFSLELAGSVQTVLVIETSNDLVNWEPYQTVHATDQPLSLSGLIDDSRSRFFRFQPLR